MSLFICENYYTFCPADCPFDDSFQCPFFEAEVEEYHQYSIWELI